VDADLLDRHAWTLDLIHPDPDRRSTALVRHHELLRQWREGLAWLPTSGRMVRVTNQVSTEIAQVRKAAWATYGETVSGAVSEFLMPGAPENHVRFAPHAVLYLQWEARFPQEWRAAAPYTPWGTKKDVLWHFADRGPTVATRAALEDLVMAAVCRPHRCEDRRFSALARRLDGPGLRARLREASGAEDPNVALRATFVCWVLDHPDAPVTVASWRNWVAAHLR